VSRKKFSSYLLVKNFLQFSLAVIVYWLIGYAFSFGDVDSEFIGEEYFGGDDWLEKRDEGHGFCFSYNVLVGIFVIFIVNNALIEKVSYITYVVYPICLLIWIWPVVVAWSWGSGWLHDEIEDRMLDYGGSATVFTFAGGFGLIGAIFSGPRSKRFKRPENFRIESVEIYVLGSFLTILGVLGIGYSQQSINGGIALANMWICGAVSSIIGLKLLTIYKKDVSDHYIAIYQGFIAGMVLIASSAGNTRPWVSALHGLISGVVFTLGVYFVKVTKIDDPANVTATFLIPGIFGGVLPGFIDNDKGVYFAGWESGQTLGTNVVGTAVILGWSIFWAAIVFGVLRVVNALKLKEKHGLEGAVITQMGFCKGGQEAQEKHGTEDQN
jgi:Amt family ammonium transporter